MKSTTTRRTFLATLGGLIASAPLAGHAQHEHHKKKTMAGASMMSPDNKHDAKMDHTHMGHDLMGPEFAWRDPARPLSPPPSTMGKPMGQTHTLNVPPLGFEMDGKIKVFKIIAQPVTRYFTDGKPKSSWNIIQKNFRYTGGMQHDYPQRVLLWGYNGQVPGPTIECIQGDTIRVILKNELPEPTSIHWHGLEVPNNMDGAGGTTEPVTPPGGTRIYQFTLHQTGTFMYHTGFNMMKQDGLGLGGFLVIHPKKYTHKIHKDVAKAAERRRDFGYLTELDIYLAYDAVAEAEIKLSEIEMELAQAKAHLARVLGIEEPGLSLVVVGRPSEPPDQLPEMKEAIVHAFTHRLDVQVTRLKITEAEHELRYQKSRPIRELRAGVNWEKESSGDQGIGPQIETELPIFNLNQGQIAKANFMIRIAKKKLLAKQGQVREQIIHDLESITFLQQKINQFENRIIPLKEKAFQYTQRWAMLMQINRILMLETQKELFESHLELIRAKRNFYQAINDLEYHLGGRWY